MSTAQLGLMNSAVSPIESKLNKDKHGNHGILKRGGTFTLETQKEIGEHIRKMNSGEVKKVDKYKSRRHDIYAVVESEEEGKGEGKEKYQDTAVREELRELPKVDIVYIIEKQYLETMRDN